MVVSLASESLVAASSRLPVNASDVAEPMDRAPAGLAELPSAVMVTFPPAESALFCTRALVFVKMTLVAAAPAPLTANPTVPARAAAAEAATATEWMPACSRALNVMSPVVTMWRALRILASTWLSISLVARETPMETATPTLPENEAASEAPTVTALMREVSWAVNAMEPAWMPLAPSPSM